MELDNLDNPTATAPEAPDAVAGEAPRRGPGAPAGNVNRLCNGSRTRRPALSLTGLAKRFPGCCADARRYARFLRVKTKEAHGRITHSQEELINEAARFELASRIWQWIIANDKTVGNDKVIDLLTKVTQATQCRKAAVARLKLDGSIISNDSPLSSLYVPEQPTTPQDATSPDEAAESTSDAEAVQQ